VIQAITGVKQKFIHFMEGMFLQVNLALFIAEGVCKEERMSMLWMPMRVNTSHK
jgi:hypothetical protein